MNIYVQVNEALRLKKVVRSAVLYKKKFLYFLLINKKMDFQFYKKYI